MELYDCVVEVPEGYSLQENIHLHDSLILPLPEGEEPPAFDASKGYQPFWRDENLLEKARAMQPLFETHPILLKSKSITLFNDKKPSGWYTSGWRDMDMKTVKGKGLESDVALAMYSKGAGGGGANFQTKRPGGAINLIDYEPTDWALRFFVNTGKKEFPKLSVRALSSREELKTKEIPFSVSQHKSGWQQVEIPLNDFLTAGSAFWKDFSGVSIRSFGALPTDLLIDRLTLEPRQK
jgi:hypothetical protein